MKTMMKHLLLTTLTQLISGAAFSQETEQTLTLREHISGVDNSGREVYRVNYTYNDFGYLTSYKTYEWDPTADKLKLVTDSHYGYYSYIKEYDFDDQNRPTRYSKFLCDANGNKGKEEIRVLATYGGEYNYFVSSYTLDDYDEEDDKLYPSYEHGYDQWNNLCYYVDYSTNGQYYIKEKVVQRFIGEAYDGNRTESPYSGIDYDKRDKLCYYYLRALREYNAEENKNVYHLTGKKKEHPTDEDYSYYIDATVSEADIEDFSNLDNLWVRYNDGDDDDNRPVTRSSARRAHQHYFDGNWEIDIETQTDGEGNIVSGRMQRIWHADTNGYRIYSPEYEYSNPVAPFDDEDLMAHPVEYYIEDYIWQPEWDYEENRPGGDWILMYAHGTKIEAVDNGLVAEQYVVGDNGKPKLSTQIRYYYDSHYRLVKRQWEYNLNGNYGAETATEYTYIDDTSRLVKTMKTAARTDTYYYINHRYVNPETLAVREVLLNRNSAPTWYTLQGTRLNGQPQQSGIYIFNGKKVTVK